MANRIPIGGGSSDPQARNSENVRSTPVRLPDYDPRPSAGKHGSPEAKAWIEAVKANNAGMSDSKLDSLRVWAQGQINAYESYMDGVKGESSLTATDWLETNGPEILAELDLKRSTRTAGKIREAIDRRDETIDSGYQRPAVRRRGQDDLDLVAPGAEEASPKVSSEERSLNTMRAGAGEKSLHTFGNIDRGEIERDIAWLESEHGIPKQFSRAEFTAYGNYLRCLGRLGTEIGFRSWALTNFRQAKGMIR